MSLIFLDKKCSSFLIELIASFTNRPNPLQCLEKFDGSVATILDTMNCFSFFRVTPLLVWSKIVATEPGLLSTLITLGVECLAFVSAFRKNRFAASLSRFAVVS